MSSNNNIMFNNNDRESAMITRRKNWAEQGFVGPNARSDAIRHQLISDFSSQIDSRNKASTDGALLRQSHSQMRSEHQESLKKGEKISKKNSVKSSERNSYRNDMMKKEAEEMLNHLEGRLEQEKKHFIRVAPSIVSKKLTVGGVTKENAETYFNIANASFYTIIGAFKNGLMSSETFISEIQREEKDEEKDVINTFVSIYKRMYYFVSVDPNYTNPFFNLNVIMSFFKNGAIVDQEGMDELIKKSYPFFSYPLLYVINLNLN